MKKILPGLAIPVLILAFPAVAEEGILCDAHYKNVQRKAENIKSYGSDLSSMAKEKLFDGLKYDTRQCISECEGQEFKYCNEVAKWISS